MLNKKKFVTFFLAFVLVVFFSNVAFGAIFGYAPKKKKTVDLITHESNKTVWEYTDFGKRDKRTDYNSNEEITEQRVWKYDDSNRVDEEIYKSQNENGELQHQKRTVYKYSPSMNKVEDEITYYYNDTANEWNFSNRTVYYFNSSNNNKIDNWKLWVYNDTKQWELKEKKEYVFNATGNNKLTKTIETAYNSSSWNWYNDLSTKKYEFTYDASTQLRDEVITYWYNSAAKEWQLEPKKDESGNIKVTGKKTLYEYNENNQLTEMKNYFHNGTDWEGGPSNPDNPWGPIIDEGKTEFLYIGDTNKIDMKLNYEYNLRTNSWGLGKEEYGNLFDETDRIDKIYYGNEEDTVEWADNATTEHIENNVKNYDLDNHWQKWQIREYGKVNSVVKGGGGSDDDNNWVEGAFGCVTNPAASFDYSWLLLLAVPAFIAGRRLKDLKI